jgi:hypothetical protein
LLIPLSAMKINNIYCALAVVGALVLAACGGGGAGVPLGAFADLTATEGDAPIVLKAPESKSPAVFAYSSSNPQVATISGSKVTILLAGTTTITAAQPSLGSYNPTSTSALLTVRPRVCTAPATNQAGVCVTPLVCTAPAVNVNGACVTPLVCTAPSISVNGACQMPCIAPAKDQNGVCVATTTSGNFVTQNGHSWMPVTLADTWENANAFCTNTTINGVTGWRLPTEFDLTELYASGAISGHGWALGQTWSSSKSFNDQFAGLIHQAVNLATGTSGPQPNGSGAYVTCVR